MPIIGTIASSTRQGLSTNSYDAIATATASGSSTITFSAIPNTYRHLQLRFGVVGAGGATLRLTFNADGAGNYSYHKISSSGSSFETNVNSGQNSIIFYTQQGMRSNVLANMIVDILDYKSTSKYKSVRTMLGSVGLGSPPGSSSTEINGGYYFADTNAISRIDLAISTGTYTEGFISLYGIKG